MKLEGSQPIYQQSRIPSKTKQRSAMIGKVERKIHNLVERHLGKKGDLGF
jgi:hypothetical protein